jgi:hypothetical protein
MKNYGQPNCKLSQTRYSRREHAFCSVAGVRDATIGRDPEGFDCKKHSCRKADRAALWFRECQFCTPPQKGTRSG